jgi:hypothetical protein
MLFKRVVPLLALAAGSLGLVACIAGAYPISLVKTRLDRTNERVFVTIDKGLASAQDRVRAVQERVRESKIRTSEIGPKLRDWRASKANERLASAVEIKSRIEKILGRLQTADQLLQKSMDSIGVIRDAREWLVLIGVPADSISPDKVLEKLTSTQGKLREIERSINGVGEFTVNRVGESEDNRLSRVFELLSNTELTRRRRGRAIAGRRSAGRERLEAASCQGSNHGRCRRVAHGAQANERQPVKLAAARGLVS